MNLNPASSPILSIITVNRNNAIGVKRTIESLLPLQSEADIEYLFIDGMSTDVSVPMASTFYRQDRLISEPDAGIYQAMNKGLSLATGQWVVWLNSGDEWVSQSWPQLKDHLLGSNACALFGASEIVDETTGKCIRTNYVHQQCLPWGMVNHSSAIIRRFIALQYQGYNESYRIAADRELVVRLYLNHEVIDYSRLCLSRFWLGGISDRRLLLRAQENLRLDHEAGLISLSAYCYGIIRQSFYYMMVRPGVLLVRRIAMAFGIQLPPLGSYAGLLGELRRDAFAGKNQR